MMDLMKRLGAAVVLGVLLMNSVALAHPNHKVMGTVTMVAADHLMLKDKAGKEHTIKLVKTTKVTKNKKPMKAADIAVGTRVVVTAVSDSDLTAKVIEVGAAPASAAAAK